MVRLSEEEHERLSHAATTQGATLAGFLRTSGHQQLAAEHAAVSFLPSLPDQIPSQAARCIAVLIDADNAQPSLLAPALAEAAKHGAVSTRRIYGDWSSPQMSQWREAVKAHALHPVQQFPNASGKNSTDIALVIDAMDLLHAGQLGGICIVSSDSDYAPLATRIREHGLVAMGIGRRETPKAFVTACDVFVYTDNLRSSQPPQGDGSEAAADDGPRPEWTEMVADAAALAQGEDGWALLSRVGLFLRQIDPAFDPRSYGMPSSRLLPLVQSRPDLFEVDPTGGTGGHPTLKVHDAEQPESLQQQ
ncbi:MAG: NYN domain-containing protein [Acidimicrobiaceae bacterium]|nr:NYN domain-containing protein [Acidimicrobiaceae bacterium]MYF34449.1 NYN domain-containing protein [Acidimicrobiaceae bacterium]